MGYTHSASIQRQHLEQYVATLPLVTADFARLYQAKAFPFPLAGPLGQGEPEFSPSLAFNGVAPEDYETFWLPTLEEVDRYWPNENEPLYLFTKTGPDREGRRPYDLAVMAGFVLLKWHLGDAISVESDGNLLDWVPATRLVTRHLGYPVDPYFVLSRRLYQAGPVLVEVAPSPLVEVASSAKAPAERVRQVLHAWLEHGELDPAYQRLLEEALASTPEETVALPGKPIAPGARVYLSAVRAWTS